MVSVSRTASVSWCRKLLPYEQKIIHVRWSGESCWIPLGDYDLGVPWEDATSVPQAGEILFYPGGYSETEILFPYYGTVFKSKPGAHKEPSGARWPGRAA